METASAKQRNSTKTKARILAAAKSAFAKFGYPRVGIRELADMANVNNALLSRYFGSKAGLFEAALIDSINLEIMGTKKDNFAQEVMDGLLNLDQDTARMVLKSAGDAEVRDITTKVTNEHIIPRMAALLGPPNAEERALNILILSYGFLFSTRLAPVGPVDKRYTQEWLFQSLQSIVSKSEGSTDSDEMRKLEEENARLRRLIVDVLLEKVQSEKIGGRGA